MDDEKDGSAEEVAQEGKEEKSISADLIRGHINTIILRALYDGDKYGYEIIAEIERKSHGQYSLKQPSLYSALKRLEKDGFVTSYWGGSVAGGRRKYFSLTDEGRAISEQNQSEWEYSRTVIDSLISDKDFDFNNPAPTLVNMRVLRSSTSRVPSREGEDDELDYEPTYDDTLDVQRLQAEFDEKNAALEAEKADLAAEREKFEEEMRAREQEAVAEREAEKAGLVAERQRFEEEMRAREQEAVAERDWRERELEARENAIERERTRVEELLASNRRGAEEQEAALEANRAAEDARVSERMHALEEEENARKAALEAEETARKRALEEEEAIRRSVLAAEEAERRRTLSEEETARRRALDEEENARKAALEAEESARRRVLEEAEAQRQASDERQAEELRAREQELAEREALYTEERKRFAELLRQRDEQLETERRAHANDLAQQEQRILREQEAIFRQRERELLHKNYLDLVSAPPKPSGTPYFSVEETLSEPEEPIAPSETDYRPVVRNIYAGTVDRGSAKYEARPVDGIDFSDLESRAQYDGIKITTTGSRFEKAPEDAPEATVHKGKALFLSAIVVFCLCVIEGGILLAVQAQYAIPVYFPYLIWAIGVALLLVTGLAYANHYGKRAIRRTAPIMVNAVVLYALCVIVTLIVALAVKIDFTSISDIATYIVVPVVFFFGIVVFGICYYLLTRPYQKKK